MNYGIRYEPFLPWTEKFNRIGQFNPAALAAGRVSTKYPNAPSGLLFSGDAGVPVNGINATYKDAMPRLGFAYDVRGDGKTSVRGGFGLFYDSRLNAAWNNGFSNLQPFVTSVSQTYQPGYYSGRQGDFANPYSGSNHAFANPFPTSTPPPATSTFGPNSWITFNPTGNFPVPLTYVWNISLEQQLAPGLASRFAYVGTHGSHNFTSIDINPTFNSINDRARTDWRLTSASACTAFRTQPMRRIRLRRQSWAEARTTTRCRRRWNSVCGTVARNG